MSLYSFEGCKSQKNLLEIWGLHTYFSILNAWLRNQAFQFHNYTKIFLELQ